jgi:hypothetical protein
MSIKIAGRVGGGFRRTPSNLPDYRRRTETSTEMQDYG